MLRALIFDFDGTIAETERDGHRVAYNEAFADLGLAWSWGVDRYGELLRVAGGKERIAAFIASDDPPRPAVDPMELARRIHTRKIERFARHAGTIALRPGVARIVREARDAGLRCAIATTASEAGVRAVLERVPETFAAFDVIAAGDVVSRKKPAPDIYAYALEKLGVDAADAVALEDSAIGLAAARAAGIATIVVPSGYTLGEDFAGAALIAPSLDGGEGHPAIDMRTIREIVER